MLSRNYTTKVGAWEYDPADNDIHFSVQYPIEDGNLTKKQFLRGFAVIIQSADLILEMKQVIGLAPAMDDKERKRQELLRQLKELESDSGSI